MRKPIEIWISPLTHRIFVGRSRAAGVGRLATEKQDVTTECINGAIMHLVAVGQLDIVTTELDGKRYRVKITPEDA